MQNGAKTSVQRQDDGHQLRIGPALSDGDVQPLTEYGVCQTKPDEISSENQASSRVPWPTLSNKEERRSSAKKERLEYLQQCNAGLRKRSHAKFRAAISCRMAIARLPIRGSGVPATQGIEMRLMARWTLFQPVRMTSGLLNSQMGGWRFRGAGPCLTRPDVS